MNSLLMILTNYVSWFFLTQVYLPGRCWRGCRAQRTWPCTPTCKAECRGVTGSLRRGSAASTVSTGPVWPSGRSAAPAVGSVLSYELHRQTQNSERNSLLCAAVVVQHLGPLLTECNQRSDDRHGQRSHEKVDGAGQEGDLPHTGVTQADDIGVSVVHLDVALDASLGREGTADLWGQTRGHFLVFNFPFCFWLVLFIVNMFDLFFKHPNNNQ